MKNKIIKLVLLVFTTEALVSFGLPNFQCKGEFSFLDASVVTNDYKEIYK